MRLIGSIIVVVVSLLIWSLGCSNGGSQSSLPTTTATPPPNFPQSASLSVPFHTQNTGEWCWAAATAMVADYMKTFPVLDCQILTEYDIRFWNGPGLCCSTGECVRPGTTAEIQAMLANIFYIQSELVLRPLSLAELQQTIGAGRPVIAHLQGFSGHFVVISAYDITQQTVTVLDPFYGPFVNVPYSSVAANWTTGVWDASIVISSDRSLGHPCQITQEFVPVLNVFRPRISCSS